MNLPNEEMIMIFKLHFLEFLLSRYHLCCNSLKQKNNIFRLQFKIKGFSKEEINQVKANMINISYILII